MRARNISLLAAVFSLLLAGSAAPAQTFTAAPNNKFLVDLDTMDGHFSNWEHDDLGSLNALRASLKVTRLGNIAKWLPYFTVWLYAKSPGSNGVCGLVLDAPARKPPLNARLDCRIDGSKVTPQPFSKTLNVNEAVDLEMSWIDANKLTVRLGTETRTLPLPWGVSKLAVSSSTGEFVLTDLTLGTMAR